MALIKCPECGKEISDKAKMCIGCGFPLEEMKLQEEMEPEKEVVEEQLTNCLYCNSVSFDDDGYCNECGMKRSINKPQKIQKECSDSIYTICPVCNKRNGKDDYRCVFCGHIYKVEEFVLHIDEEKINEGYTFRGVYRYGRDGLREVYCPRCNSDNCVHHKEQKIIPAKTKTRYTANLNPLRPFTLINKKEKVVRRETSYVEDKFLCNNCGYIFK